MKKLLPPNARARHREEGQAKVRCNAIYKNQKNLNVKLKATQALQLAKGLIQKAQILLEEEDGLADDWAVHLWSTGGNRLYCGLSPATKKSQSD